MLIQYYYTGYRFAEKNDLLRITEKLTTTHPLEIYLLFSFATLFSVEILEFLISLEFCHDIAYLQYVSTVNINRFFVRKNGYFFPISKNLHFFTFITPFYIPDRLIMLFVKFCARLQKNMSSLEFFKALPFQALVIEEAYLFLNFQGSSGT